MSNSTSILFPPGRLVWGSVYQPNDKNAEGLPLTIKTGPNAGQPMKRWEFGVAIAKGNETRWDQTAWGRDISEAGARLWLDGSYKRPSFAWKITDGDSDIPNSAGKIPNQRVGWAGHWILAFGSSYMPRLVNRDGTADLQDPSMVKRGYYVQVLASISSNNSTNRSGIFLNPQIVALSAYGDEIASAPSPTAVGFGRAPLPAGASAIPIGALPRPAPVAENDSLASDAAFLAQDTATPPRVTVPPHFGILTPPQAPRQAYIMTDKAQGATQQQLVAAGWTTEQLLEHGLMVERETL